MKPSPASLQRTHLSKRFTPLATTLGILLAVSAQAATSTWKTSGITGNWSDSAMWDTALTSATDSIANISCTTAAATTTVIDTASWTLYGLQVTATSGPRVYINARATGGSTLNLGAGGITVTGTGTSPLWFGQAGSALTINATADQTWTANCNVFLQGNLSGASQITLNNTGGGYLRFYSGNSTGFTGSVKLQSGGIVFSNATQLDRLGSNALTWNNSGNSNGVTTLDFSSIFAKTSGTNYTFATPLSFSQTGTDGRTISVNATATTNSSMIFTGAWTGNLSSGSGTTAALQFTNSAGGLDGATESQFLVRLQGNSSTLTTSKTGGSLANSAVYFRSGAYLIENANALGSGNSLPVAVGGDSRLNGYSALLTKDGIDIAGKVYVNKDSTNNRSNYTKLGLNGTGSAKFTGDIVLGQVTNSSYRANNLHLSAAPGGTASFTGNISDEGLSNPTSSTTITVDGGGKVVLGGSNTNLAGVSVVGNTTLAANGKSSTGTGSVKIGAAASAPFTGDISNNATGNWIVSNVSSTAGLVVGQSITGTNIPLGATITFIGSNFIEISARTAVTATGVSLTAGAETGILSGTGAIAPGASQSIHVSAGSSIAPGDGGIGQLTLDGGSTAAALLTMASGAGFTFDLGIGGNSDQLIFWNYAAGDLGLNANDIALNGAQAGTYTLMSFYSDSGSTAVSTGDISGLVTGLTISGYDEEAYNASLTANGNSIVLTMTAVPEPSTWAMIIGGTGLLVLGQRMRRKTIA